jgi:hypothetical protein
MAEVTLRGRSFLKQKPSRVFRGEVPLPTTFLP